MRALIAPTLFIVTLTGAVLAAPVPVLALRSGDITATLTLDDGMRFTSSYLQSIYHAPVIEELEGRDGAIHLVRVRSTDRRAIEYFGWSGPIGSDGPWFVEEAPPYDTPGLLIRTTAAYDQQIATSRTSLALAPIFGDEVRVTVTPATLPRVMLLLAAR